MLTAGDVDVACGGDGALLTPPFTCRCRKNLTMPQTATPTDTTRRTIRRAIKPRRIICSVRSPLEEQSQLEAMVGSDRCVGLVMAGNRSSHDYHMHYLMSPQIDVYTYYIYMYVHVYTCTCMCLYMIFLLLF